MSFEWLANIVAGGHTPCINALSMPSDALEWHPKGPLLSYIIGKLEMSWNHFWGPLQGLIHLLNDIDIRKGARAPLSAAHATLALHRWPHQTCLSHIESPIQRKDFFQGTTIWHPFSGQTFPEGLNRGQRSISVQYSPLTSIDSLPLQSMRMGQTSNLNKYRIARIHLKDRIDRYS